MAKVSSKDMNIDSFTYKDAGVDIDAGNESVRKIRKLVRSTYNESVITDIGTFGGMLDIKALISNYRHPVLVQSIDSVGTKLIVAEKMGRHNSIGIDMVAHSCNDILCQGARPIAFLDYIAADKITPAHIQQILDGIAVGCREVGLPVLGGEIAELPGVYTKGHYDLVGAVTGVVEKEKIITGRTVRPGHILLGLSSNGLHTNGYSLARKVLFDIAGLDIHNNIPELDECLGDELLRPHRNYVPPVLPLLENFSIHGIAHITGGGLLDNLPRILPPDCGVQIHKGSWVIPAIFNLIRECGNVPEVDMYRTFNMGIGLILMVSEEESQDISAGFSSVDYAVSRIGEVIAGDKTVSLTE
jgi:phosphoribosylformylglycinamidine cyclo-ligase